MLKVDHTQTSRALDQITAALHNQAKALEVYFKECDFGEDQAMYSAQYLQGLADKALEKLVAVAQKNTETFADALESARECERNNEGAIDFTDPTLQGILSAIDAFQGKDLLTTNTGDGELYKELSGSGKIVEAALEELRGQRNALELVKNKLESKGYEILKSWKEYFYSLDLFDNLDEALGNVSSSPKSGLYYLNAKTELLKVAKALGLQLRESDLDFGGIGGSVIESAMRAAAGIEE